MFERHRSNPGPVGALLAALLVSSGPLQATSLQEPPPVQSADSVAVASETAAPVVQAVWKLQTFDFHYQSFTTFYSCSSLSEKVRRILVELGGDEQTKVRVSGCEAGSSIALMPLVRVTMASPVEATPEALAELQKTRPVRELAARVRNDRSKNVDLNAHVDIDAQFPALWKRVSLSRGALGLSPGDCELIEQIERKVLPKLAVRVVASDMRCMPNQLSMGQPKLEVDALADLPKADEQVGGKKKKRGT
jgi:hypothetical protein